MNKESVYEELNTYDSSSPSLELSGEITPYTPMSAASSTSNKNDDDDDIYNLPSSSSILQIMSKEARFTTSPSQPSKRGSGLGLHIRAPSFNFHSPLKKKTSHFTVKVDKELHEDKPPQLPDYQVVEEVARKEMDAKMEKKLEDSYCCICCCNHSEEFFMGKHRVTQENFDKFSKVIHDYEDVYGITHYSTGKKDLVCDQVYHCVMHLYKFKQKRMLLPEQKQEQKEEERKSFDRSRPSSVEKVRKVSMDKVGRPSLENSRKSLTLSAESLDVIRKSLDGKSDGLLSIEDVELRILEVIEETTRGIQNQIHEQFSRPKVLDIVKDLAKIAVALFITLSLIFLGAVPICYIERANEMKQNGKVQTWYYGNAVYYTITTLTTIGLGDITPATTGGKVYMMIFTMITMGFVGLCLALAGESLLRSAGTLSFLAVLYTKRLILVSFKLCCMQLTDDNDDFILDPTIIFSDELTKVEKWMYHFINGGITQIIFTFLILVCYALVSAAIYRSLEGWSYFHSLWFCFVTLTTIGYGDYTPSKDATKIYYCFYIIFGTATVALFLGFIGQAVADRIKKSIAAIQKKAIEEARASEKRVAMTKLQVIMQEARTREKAVRSQLENFKRKQKEKAQRKASAFVKHRHSIHAAAKEKTENIGKGIKNQIKHIQEKQEIQKNAQLNSVIDQLNHDDEQE